MITQLITAVKKLAVAPRIKLSKEKWGKILPAWVLDVEELWLNKASDCWEHRQSDAER